MNEKSSLYTIKKLSEASGLPVSTINHYLNIELLKEKNRGANNYRLFGEKQRKTLETISELRTQGFSTAQIKQRLEKRG